ncbi:2-dehydropantoate 2-reductase [Pontibacter sp. 172403-2]|uniref:ketopantoate reductase family protein n=1 Tax=Pontibacter rufus TaxID=2791028 RepID=UPI0018AFB780|nr:2-dehydropantoate 2-reductase [Pontibacter sp. 172403-2]MBF9251728.1 2-dehydropantoate 2-reductase [Pontibacter sp. 172403-2]
MENRHTDKYKILILGIGGIGGYFGGKLAAHYRDSPEVEVGFFARGAHADEIAKNGLQLHTTQGNLTARPAYVTDNPDALHPVDLLICCVKSYDLEDSLQRVRPCISENTIILPLLNGVDAPARIREMFQGTEVWEGCVYVIARLAAPGIVKEKGGMGLLYFGSSEASPDKLRRVESVFQAAGVRAEAAVDILHTIWAKFLFISAVATATSYLDTSMGAILEKEDSRQLLLRLLGELQAVAKAKGIILSDDMIPAMLQRMASLPYGTTSSMHSDFQKGGKTELESLTGYVVREGEALDVPVPTYAKLYAALKGRS